MNSNENDFVRTFSYFSEDKPIEYARVKIENLAGDKFADWYVIIPAENPKFIAIRAADLQKFLDEGMNTLQEVLRSILEKGLISNITVAQKDLYGIDHAMDILNRSGRNILLVEKDGIPISLLLEKDKGIVDLQPQAIAMVEESSTSQYANHLLMELENRRELPRDKPIAQGKILRLWIDIGKLKDTAIERAEPIPRELLPEGPLEFDVLLSSGDFKVSSDPSFKENRNTIAGKLILPDDGRQAKTPDGDDHLWFYLRAPMGSGKVRARIGYYYNNYIVQSFLLRASIGEQDGGYSFICDFTLSENFAETEKLGNLPPKNFLSVFSEKGEKDEHILIVRAHTSGTENAPNVCEYKLNEQTINSIMEELRDETYNTIRFKKRDLKGRRIDDFKRDLRIFSDIGYKLFSTVSTSCMREWLIDNKQHGDVLVDVSRPKEYSYSFPWQFFYDIPLISDTEYEICKVINELDSLIADNPSINQCPYHNDPGHQKNILCPFGFWGFRYKIQQHAGKGKQPNLTINTDEKSEMLIANTTSIHNEGELRAHIKHLENIVKKKGGIAQNKIKKDEILAKLGDPSLPLVYFYCHSFRKSGYETTSYLSVGSGEKIEINDFKSYYDIWYKNFGEKNINKK